ncbi:MAG: replication-associated recombination protein A [Oscillospiraceae bacterium]|jgi:putative ATPase|nr:replication-associated recombination protein A [Oscillospiraceae bacterium]
MPAPLAERLRPQQLDEMVGQPHLLGEGRALRRIVLSGELPNLIFYGPSGVGKTTFANIIAKQTQRYFVRLNGTTAGTADIKEVVAKLDTFLAPNGVLLYLDEIQYFNKKQQQTLLEHIENGAITLIASTTENPYFYVYNAILSRSTVFEFKPLTPEDILPAVERAFRFLRGETGAVCEIEPGVSQWIATACGGDARKAMNAAELCWLSAPQEETNPKANQSEPGGYTRKITLELAKELTQRSAVRYDREGDEHYDIVSAFQKAMRGSDPDAALHYLARLLEAGDMPSAMRRLMVCACEDVGLAYPQIIPIVKAAVDAAQMVGLPEAQIPLADAVILVATAPKSNSGVEAISAAMADVKAGKGGAIPRSLQNKHFDGADNSKPGQFYQYPHAYPNHWVAQQYLPDAMQGTVYYAYGENKTEQAAKAYHQRLQET